MNLYLQYKWWHILYFVFVEKYIILPMSLFNCHNWFLILAIGLYYILVTHPFFKMQWVSGNLEAHAHKYLFITNADWLEEFRKTKNDENFFNCESPPSTAADHASCYMQHYLKIGPISEIWNYSMTQFISFCTGHSIFKKTKGAVFDSHCNPCVK